MVEQVICKQCGQPIWGKYFTALGSTWHPEHFLCTGCGKPIAEDQFQVHKGTPYHAECYRDQIAPRCTYCHKPLVGQYQVYQGNSYHAECYCDHVAHRCAYCGKPLLGEYRIDQWGTKYCKEHQNQYPKCAFCGRLVPPQQQESGARRNESVRCPICRSTAIETRTEAQAIFTQLQQWVSSQGLVYNNLKLSIELCDRTKLATLVKGRGGRDALGVTLSTTHTLNGQEIRTDVDGIAILQGLPSTLFQGVCVHELGHAWLVVWRIKGLPPWAEEGFCELLSHRFYTELNTAESRQHAESIEKNPDQVYGEGFRRIRALADKMGFHRFVETLQTTRHLPNSKL